MSDLTMNEIRHCKATLELDLRDMLENFREATGLQVTEVSLHLLSSRNLESAPTLRLSHVTVKVPL